MMWLRTSLEIELEKQESPKREIVESGVYYTCLHSMQYASESLLAKPYLNEFLSVPKSNRIGEPMKGYVAVQKKLLTLCYGIWKNDTEYDPNYSARRSDNNVKEHQNIGKKIVPTSGTTQDIAA